MIIINSGICHSATMVQTPASEISQEVVTRLSPEITQAMENKALRLGAPIFMRIFKESDELEIWVLQGSGLFSSRPTGSAIIRGTSVPRRRRETNRARRDSTGSDRLSSIPGAGFTWRSISVIPTSMTASTAGPGTR